MTAVDERPKRKGTKPPAPPDEALSYARDVLSGKVVAGRAVRLACHRHIDDLAKQRTAAFPYYYDAKAAAHIINFFPQFLTLENGNPFVLPPWLAFSYGVIFGWKCWGGDGKVALPDEHVTRAGKRRFRHGFFETSKGSGKTPSAGGVGLYGLAYDDEQSAQIYSTGFDKGQASIILDDAIRMAENAPDDEFRDEFEVGKYNIAHLPSRSFFTAMSSQHQSKSGPRPHYVLSDEIHEHRDGTVVSKAESGFKFRMQPLGLKYTNSGSDKTSYCWELHQKSLSVLEGTQPDEQWFAYVCHLDPCEACYQDGYRQPNDGCPDCDNWMDEAVWPKIAPALGIVIHRQYLRDAINTALTVPSEFNLKRRLNFCIWTETHNVWISPERWKTCQVEHVSADNASAFACAAGLDPSSTKDLTSLVVAIRRPDPPSIEPVSDVEVEGLNEFGQRIIQAFKLNFTIELVPFFWIPEDTMHERVRTERIPFDVWHRANKLFVTKGPAIDHNAIYDFVLKEAWPKFKIQQLGMDENGGRYLFIKFGTEGRLEQDKQLVQVGQAKKLSEAYKFMEILIAHRRLIHDGHPVLAWNMANAEPQRDRLGALWMEKPSDTKRIDGCVASAMAIARLMALPDSRPGPQMFFLGAKR